MNKLTPLVQVIEWKSMSLDLFPSVSELRQNRNQLGAQTEMGRIREKQSGAQGRGVKILIRQKSALREKVASSSVRNISFAILQSELSLSPTNVPLRLWHYTNEYIIGKFGILWDTNCSLWIKLWPSFESVESIMPSRCLHPHSLLVHPLQLNWVVHVGPRHWFVGVMLLVWHPVRHPSGLE